jgi:phospholipid-translocating ATPase
LLSGDQEASTMSCAYALQLTDALSSKILNITRKSREKIFFEINNAVGLVQQEMNKNNISTSKQMPVQKPRSIKSSTTIYSDDNYNKMNIFTLCINGHSLTNILKHNELLSHFRFLCCICRTVIGYNLNPQQKRFMCAMVKNNFPNKPTVIAVGDGFNDALMMQEADVSIEVLNKGRKGKEYKP